MRILSALALVPLAVASAWATGALVSAQNPGQPHAGGVRIDGQPGPAAPRPPRPPPLDVSDEVRLTIAAVRDRYEQLEPIKLRVELTNLSKSDMSYEDETECRLIGFEIVDLLSTVAVEDVTNYSKFLNANRKPGRGPILLKPGETLRFTAYPNLCIDLTLPRRYSIAATMELKRTADGRRCVTRGKLIFVEVDYLL